MLWLPRCTCLVRCYWDDARYATNLTAHVHTHLAASLCTVIATRPPVRPCSVTSATTRSTIRRMAPLCTTTTRCSPTTMSTDDDELGLVQTHHQLQEFSTAQVHPPRWLSLPTVCAVEGCAHPPSHPASQTLSVGGRRGTAMQHNLKRQAGIASQYHHHQLHHHHPQRTIKCQLCVACTSDCHDLIQRIQHTWCRDAKVQVWHDEAIATACVGGYQAPVLAAFCRVADDGNQVVQYVNGFGRRQAGGSIS